MKKIYANNFFTPFAFLALCLIAYGLLIPWLGFYWDDFPYTWFARTLGPGGIVHALAEDRPILAGIYVVTTSLLGDHPVVWQIFAVIWRWVLTMVFWWTLRLVWPTHVRSATWAALLFTVYPGFQQHWISVIYSQAYVLMAAFLASLGLMIKSLRATRAWPYTLLALLLSAFSFFSTEYFFGVELIRPLLIWIVLAQKGVDGRKRYLSALKWWTPYLAELILFVIWRGFLFDASTYHVQALNGSIFTIGIDLLRTALVNGFIGSWSAWAQAAALPFALDYQVKSSLAYALVATSGLLATGVFLFLLQRKHAAESETDAAWSIQAMIVGAAALLAASIPFWVANLPFNLEFPYNRFSLAMIPGVSLLLAGMIEFLIRTPRQKTVILALLIAAAVGFQFQTANSFRREWDTLKDFFWQLIWRAPDIEPGTLVLTHQFPFQYYSDNSLAAALNWIYAPDLSSAEMPYMVNYATVRLGSSLPSLAANTTLNQDYRAMTFHGNTSDSLVVFYSPPGCLRVLDSRYNHKSAIPGLNNLLAKAIPLSDLEKIIVRPEQPVHPPTILFGKEPSGNWCYYFQKAELARQSEDWKTVSSYGDQAFEKDLRPANANEWLVFIEGYARSGQIEQAVELSATADDEPKLAAGLCQLWERVKAATTQPEELTRIQQVEDDLKCALNQPIQQP